MAKQPEHPVIYADDLDRKTCEHKDCSATAHSHEMVFQARCHQIPYLTAEYRAATLVLCCAECGKHVASIAVQQSPQGGA